MSQQMPVLFLLCAVFIHQHRPWGNSPFISLSDAHFLYILNPPSTQSAVEHIPTRSPPPSATTTNGTTNKIHSRGGNRRPSLHHSPSAAIHPPHSCPKDSSEIAEDSSSTQTAHPPLIWPSQSYLSQIRLDLGRALSGELDLAGESVRHPQHHRASTHPRLRSKLDNQS